MKFKDDFLHRIENLGKQWGLTAPAGRIWGVLLLNKFPLTQKEISRQCGYSLGLVSRGLKTLKNLDMISVSIGGREKIYGLKVSFIGAFERLLKHLMKEDIKPVIEILSSNLEGIKNKEVKYKVSSLIKEYEKTASFVNFFSRILSAKKSLSLSNIRKLTSKGWKLWVEPKTS